MDLLQYFSTCNDHAPPHVGMEIETDFHMGFVKESATYTPISPEITAALLDPSRATGPHWERKLELGRQKIELAIAPGPIEETLVRADQALGQLRDDASELGATMYFGDFDPSEELLWIQEERDEIWVALDGRPALEELCRCSSVQFTVNVTPSNAIAVINALWANWVHTWRYADNDRRWRNYIQMSAAGYREDRYGGPRRFKDLADYVDQIKKHNVVMHQGQPCNLPFDDVDSPDIELFLRSVWWHYRLRRYGDQLTVEIRPFGRDISFKELWERLSQVLANVNKPLFEQAMDEWFAKTRPNGAQVIHNHPQVHHHHMVGQQEPPY